MSFDIKTLDVKRGTAMTQFEAEAERRREVLAASSPAAKAAAATRPSRLVGLRQMLAGVLTGQRRSIARDDGWA
jgi:hypothetical protein